jgi:predicted RNase H-like nuclease
MPAEPRPYKILAGIVPCPHGWVVLRARLAGITLAAEGATVERSLRDLLDERPMFDAAAIDAPIGLDDEPGLPFRQCDEEAREYVGWPRAVAIYGVGSRSSYEYVTGTQAAQHEAWMNGADKRRHARLREVTMEIQPHHARRIAAGHPDVSFTAMNGDVGLRTSPWHEDGRQERLELIRQQLPGLDEVVSRTPPEGAHPKMVVDAAAMLWTARRQAGRAISRFPLDPVWDSEGIRMQLVR